MKISVSSLTKKYGSQRAVDNISFEVQTGEVLGFLGPNGAGKTTTMKIITCFMAPSDGDVKVGDYSILEHPEKVKKKIGDLPEAMFPYEHMPVLEYLEYVAELQGVSKEKIQDRVAEMVVLTGLNVEKHKKIGELSKGYKQRVGLAQAMIHDPEILVLDEPTSGLDPNQIIEIRKLIRELGRSKTVILSTHILSEVEATCDRILIINDGKIVADGTADVLKQQAEGEELLRVQISDAPSMDEAIASLMEIEKVIMVDPISDLENGLMINCRENSETRKEIFNLCVSNKWILTQMTPIETKLEDIFRELTTN